MQRLLIGAGIAILLIGLAWPLLAKLPFGRLPGDFVFERGSSRFYFPLMTSLLISVIVSVVLWLLRK